MTGLLARLTGRQRRLTTADVEAAVARGEIIPPTPHAVWDEGRQAFREMGQVVADARQARETEPAWLDAQYERHQQAVAEFIRTKLREAEYDEQGYPVRGKLNDFYQLPGYDKKTLTKAGSEKFGTRFRYRVLAAKTTHSIETPTYVSARVHVELVDAYGHPVGAFEAACSSAEAGFRTQTVQERYGAAFRRQGDELVTIQAPDYRAGLHDICARAKKRGYVGAIITALNLQDVFDVTSSTGAVGDEGGDGAGQEGRVAHVPAPNPRTTSVVERPKRITVGGRPLDMLTTADLERALETVRTMAPDDRPQWGKHEEAITRELEERRSFAVMPRAVRTADDDLMDLPVVDLPAV